jgi:hypothetical protein
MSQKWDTTHSDTTITGTERRKNNQDPDFACPLLIDHYDKIDQKISLRVCQVDDDVDGLWKESKVTPTLPSLLHFSIPSFPFPVLFLVFRTSLSSNLVIPSILFRSKLLTLLASLGICQVRDDALRATQR